MNEKVKQIALLATEWCIENAQGTPVAWEWEEKFTELIVKECMAVAIDPQCFPKDHLTLEEAFRAGQEHSMLCIKEHFGVE